MANKITFEIIAKALGFKTTDGKVKRLSGSMKRFAAGVTGGAAGETFVADVEEIGSFGDIFGGPTALRNEEEETDEDELMYYIRIFVTLFNT